MDLVKLATTHPILTLQFRLEPDLVLVRQRARQISDLLGFDDREQTRIATAVSEIVRNALGYAGGGTIEFQLDDDSRREALLIRISDSGPGIRELDAILEGRNRSGMGMGLAGARRLVDQLRIESVPGRGTTVWLRKFLSRRASSFPLQRLSSIDKQLRAPLNPFDEIKRQNQELLRTLEELRKHQEELAQLNRELEDTNRGVVALYAELDEKALHLKQADEIKSRFLSNMSHEFRTPLNSILALTRILLDRLDGDLTPEQAKQISFISRSAEDLLALVNDLLDLAKVEAGKLTVQTTTFELKELFGALRGLLKPLLLNERTTLIFEDPADIPPLHTDESKISQILRNFISNALKFTECGEIRVSAEMVSDENAVILSVADTGIGIAPEHQTLIFQEFAQLDSPLQKKVRGTGLGLPLTKKLTEFLGGSISLKSELGIGSTFSVKIPLRYPESVKDFLASKLGGRSGRLLIIENSPDVSPAFEELLKDSGFQVLQVRNLKEAQEKSRQRRPVAVLLNMPLEQECLNTLTGLKSDASLGQIPLLVVTGTVEDQAKATALGADACCMRQASKEQLLKTLDHVVRESSAKILIVDDEEISRYVLKEFLVSLGHSVIEAQGGEEGILLAREHQPQIIFLDLMMQDLSGHEVLDRLAMHRMTEAIPVIILTSKVLTEEEHQSLAAKAVTILSKSVLAKEDKGVKLQEALLKARVEGTI